MSLGLYNATNATQSIFTHLQSAISSLASSAAERLGAYAINRTANDTTLISQALHALNHPTALARGLSQFANAAQNAYPFTADQTLFGLGAAVTAAVALNFFRDCCNRNNPALVKNGAPLLEIKDPEALAAFELLKQLDPELATDKNANQLQDSPMKAAEIRKLLRLLVEYRSNYMTQARFDSLMASKSDTDIKQIVGALLDLDKREKYFDRVIECGKDAGKVARGIIKLESSKLLSNEVIGKLIEKADRAEQYAEALIALNECGKQLRTESNISCLLKVSVYTNDLCRLLVQLHNMNRLLPTQKNIDNLSKHLLSICKGDSDTVRQNLRGMIEAMECLARARPSLLNETNVSSLLKSSSNISCILSGLKANNSKLTQQTFDQLCSGDGALKIDSDEKKMKFESLEMRSAAHEESSKPSSNLGIPQELASKMKSKRLKDIRPLLGSLYQHDPSLLDESILRSFKSSLSLAHAIESMLKDFPALLTKANIINLAKNIDPSGTVLGFNLLRSIKSLATQETFDALNACGEFSYQVGRAMEMLYVSNPNLASVDNLKKLVMIPESAERLADLLGWCQSMSLNLITQPRFDALVEKSKDLRLIDSSLKILRTGLKGSREKSENYIDAIINNSEFAYSIAKAISLLEHAKMASPDNIQAAINQGFGAEQYAVFLVGLNDFMPKFANQKNISRLASSGISPQSFCELLEVLDDLNLDLLNQSNIDLLIEHAGAFMELRSFSPVIYSIRALSEAKPSLLTQNNFEALVKAGEYAFGISEGIRELKKINPSNLTQENFELLVKSRSYAPNMADALNLSRFVGMRI